ncbi:hypothetical protein L1987_74570 [Smallanthus sonchifolius]|uniref:Uncharacterized protein n=1 Tax=Smallanthus sonchifolius TaxID=185202 RepID=A0ACB9A3E6_9ASTR|nr:hypothetical protein L1987_74570 [Smallanthus sonchifolius]
METPKKPRILCLHGHGSNGATLKEHLSIWPDYVLEKMDLVFIDAPFSVDEDGELFEWFTFHKLTRGVVGGRRIDEVLEGAA